MLHNMHSYLYDGFYSSFIQVLKHLKQNNHPTKEKPRTCIHYSLMIIWYTLIWIYNLPNVKNVTLNLQESFCCQILVLWIYAPNWDRNQSGMDNDLKKQKQKNRNKHLCTINKSKQKNVIIMNYKDCQQCRKQSAMCFWTVIEEPLPRANLKDKGKNRQH